MFDSNPLQSLYMFDALRSRAEEVERERRTVIDRPRLGVWKAIASFVAACRSGSQSLWAHASHPGAPVGACDVPPRRKARPGSAAVVPRAQRQAA
jgi:hypothetical protein